MKTRLHKSLVVAVIATSLALAPSIALAGERNLKEKDPRERIVDFLKKVQKWVVGTNNDQLTPPGSNSGSKP